MKTFVCGFAFNNGGSKVLLIEKNRPAFQKGKLNGIGGKIEEGETIHSAMVREFKEETGLETRESYWFLFCSLNVNARQSHYNEEVIIHFLGMYTDKIWQAMAMTDEQIHLVDTAMVPKVSVIPNLNWLIPMFLYDSYHYTVQEGPKY